jgi:hypothetical protein
MSMYRHGDVMIASIKKLPSGCERKPHVILARGEVTGHSHRIEPNSSAVLFESGNETFLQVTESGANVIHEEHKPIELPPGLYRVWRQREYSPREIRVIRD